mgnify:CR=1 FL=1
MPVSANEIVNQALSRIGAKSSVELFEPTPEDTVEAHQAALWYHPSRRFVLEAFDWGFARTRLELALDSNDPPEGVWEYRYQYPADCLAMRYIENPAGLAADAIPFALEQPPTPADALRTILTNAENAVLVYTRDVTNPSFFTQAFIEALVNLLAARFAMPLTGNLKLADRFDTAFAKALIFASSLSANQEVDNAPREASWVRDR